MPFFWFPTLLAAFSAIVFLTPELPSPMVSHFDFGGKPNGFMAPWTFATILLVLLAFTNISLGLLHHYLYRLPLEYLNVPHKEEWLKTDSLRFQMYARVRKVLGNTAIYVNLLLLYCFLKIHAFNVHQQDISSLTWYVLASAAGFTAYVYSYLKPPKEI